MHETALKSQRTISFGTQLFRWMNPKKFKAFEGIPGPDPQFLLGNILDFKQNGKQTWDVLADYGQQYGGLSVLWMFSQPALVLNDPELIRQVLLDEQQQQEHPPSPGTRLSRCPMASAVQFYKDLPRKALRPMLTDTNTFECRDAGEAWQTLARNDPFNLPYFQEYLSTQLEALKGFMASRSKEWVNSSESAMLPAYDTLQKLTFDGFSFATVGRVFPDRVFAQFQQMCQVGTQRMTRSSLANWLICKEPLSRTYTKTSRQWFGLFSQVVADAQNNFQDDASIQSSLLGWVLQRGGTSFNAEQLRNFVAGVYPGGAVSTPSGITSALHQLWQNPAQLPPLLAEIEELFTQPLTLERLEDCTVLEQVLRETLRLRPAVRFFTRKVDGNSRIAFAGHTIPAQTPLFINNWYLHRDPHYWVEPNRFNPTRWDAATCEQNPYGSGYFFPFGRGSRACIGQEFAKVFMKLAIAVLLHQLSMEFGNESDDADFCFAVAVPKQLTMKVQLRR